MLTFKIIKSSMYTALTKKTILNFISGVYDHFLLVAPIVFLTESLLKEICTYEKRISWEYPLP